MELEKAQSSPHMVESTSHAGLSIPSPAKALFIEEFTMPIYEYRCEACGHELEALQKMSDAPLEICPECSQSALKKALSVAGFRLKGSGWHETDFKAGKKKNLHAADKPAAPKNTCSDGTCG
jgi:putative FmdB family regulatory protein